MYFVAISVRLRFTQPDAPLTAADGPHAHAVIMHALTDEDPDAGRVLHDTRRDKRVTIALVDNNIQGAVLRLTFFAENGLAYAQTLMTSLATRSCLKLGNRICLIDAVSLEEQPWGGIATWADLWKEKPCRHMVFNFAAPTAISKYGADGRWMALYPDPGDLFAGLARRWRALDGPTLPDDLDEVVRTGGCVVSSYDLKTKTFHVTNRTQIGFQGRVAYECRTESISHVVALNALSRLAPFVGIGYQTARGMGVTLTTVSDGMQP